MPAEDRPQEPRQREHVLPVRHGREDVLLHPLAVQEHALLLAARAEVTGLARVREEELVPAGVAVDAREALVRVAACDETLDDLLLDRAPNSARLAQFPRMAPRALPKRATPRVARAIEPAPG